MHTIDTKLVWIAEGLQVVVFATPVPNDYVVELETYRR